MKKIFDSIIVGSVIFLFWIGIIVCNYELTISNLEHAGYTYIKYEAGSYKVYDNKTKVIYLYSDETNEYHPVYNTDGSIMIYNK